MHLVALAIGIAEFRKDRGRHSIELSGILAARLEET